MSKKKQSNGNAGPSRKYDYLGVESDFYSSGSPSEQPLYQQRHETSMKHVRKTGRHQAVQGRRKETVDPREKMALAAVLKSMIVLVLLVIFFFLLWKSVSIYEESMFLKHQQPPEASPVMQQLELVEDFDLEKVDSRDLFAERVEMWKEATRLVRSSDALVKRDNYDLAIERCQQALEINPAHMGALEHLGELYFEKGLYIEAVNSYIRLLSVNPTRSDLKIKLIRVLDARGDAGAVVFLARWYLEENEYNEEVGRSLANALFVNEAFEEAIVAYERVLNVTPGDTASLEKMADAYMFLGTYEQALETLELLRAQNYRDQAYYQKIAVCHAQLGHGYETVQTLGKAAHLFGQPVVIGWVQDPRLDPVREDRQFQVFAERVGGEEFRKWLEKVARSMEHGQEQTVTPQLSLPKQDGLKADLLTPKQQ
ncbi:tetratricopeptide repeat protein [Pontiella agarivorans]|uniref:Tetratricopeptide repeat protein n=1 Tax=Pontiella agarivorans TaxID=3038953 RepID=A0ABU5MUJ2_9BACT|nr:tetratricopeptide repeat protein [Pontiella agarivorans]MDZ8117884.1 tetratricopeptide repeat protein [Pontiella agarivorans]